MNDKTPNPEQDELHAELAWDKTMREGQGLNALEAQRAINDALKAKAACWWGLSLAVYAGTGLGIWAGVKVVWGL